MKQLKNKIATITGAATKIGRSLAGEFIKKGCNLAISNIKKDDFHKLVDHSKQDISITPHLMDTLKKDEVYNYAKEVSQQHGGIHIVGNNTGVVVMASVEHITFDNFEWLARINLSGTVYETKTLLPSSGQEVEGYTINISSAFGVVTSPVQAAYHSIKFAMREVTECLQQELKMEAFSMKANSFLPKAIKGSQKK